jgi:hypothetical protein
MVLVGASSPSRPQRGKSDFYHMRKAGARLAPRAGHPIAFADALTMRILRWRIPIIETGNTTCQLRDRVRCQIAAGHGTRGHEQPDDPNRAAMRVGAARCGKHDSFSTAANRGQIFPQWLVRHTTLGCRCHVTERSAQRMRRTLQAVEVQIMMGAASASVDERGLWREQGFVEQRFDGSIGKL